MQEQEVKPQRGTELPNESWENTTFPIFWGEIAPCDHTVQLYNTDKVLLNTLENFAAAGLSAGDSVIVIATSAHLSALDRRLKRQKFNLKFLKDAGRYMPLDADESLSKFMVDDMPDEKLFLESVTEKIGIARKNNNRVRAFGEMVALLWQRGLTTATMRLEQLWCNLHSQSNFTLFCAYPKNIFADVSDEKLGEIYKTHSRVIDGTFCHDTEVRYKVKETV